MSDKPTEQQYNHPIVLRWNIADDYYEDGMRLYADGFLEINVGGYVTGNYLRNWFRGVEELSKLQRILDQTANALHSANAKIAELEEELVKWKPDPTFEGEPMTDEMTPSKAREIIAQFESSESFADYPGFHMVEKSRGFLSGLAYRDKQIKESGIVEALEEISERTHKENCPTKNLVGPEECGCNPPDYVAEKALARFKALMEEGK